MAIRRAEGEPARVVSAVNTGTSAITYNLTVADWETYFVGEAQVWVHNACLPSQSPIWQGLDRLRGKTRTDGNRLYQWDYTHNNIEVYNSRGRHLGVMDPVSGGMIGPAVRGRTLGD